jgi:dethiobiotin synthetase
MTRRFVVVGTDTGVGKTVIAAALADALGAFYWKPVQAGLDGETDSRTVARLAGLPPHRILPEAWRLAMPASPHIAARREGVEIDPQRLTPPDCEGPLIVETAGGVMTPLTDRVATIDVLARWGFPVVLVARTALGTINHSLLTIEALRRRGVPLVGVAFVGEADAAAQETIARMGGTRALGRLPPLAPLTRETLRAAFAARFDLSPLAPTTTRRQQF